jgi:hypothetical protein
MAIDFPASPALNDQYTYQGKTWEWDGEKWILVTGASAGHSIENEGTPLTARSSINFTGDGVTASDSGGKTVVNVPGGGVSAGILTSGYDAPTGGADGDWYIREGSTGAGMYKKVSGTWQRTGLSSSLYLDHPELLTSPWTASNVGASISTTIATVAQMFNVDQTGITKGSGARYIGSESSSGVASFYAREVQVFFEVKVLPPTQMTIGATRYDIYEPVLYITDQGAAMIINQSYPAFTFSNSVTTTTNNKFLTSISAGKLTISQYSGIVLVQSVTYPAPNITPSVVSNGYLGWVFRGDGEINILNAFVLA